MKKSAISLSLLLLAAGVSGTAWAQSDPARGSEAAGTPTPPPQAQAQQQAQLPDSSDISDQDVTQFTEAQKKVQDIKAEYRQKAQAQSQEPRKAMEVQREAQQKMLKAVKDTGMDVQKYNQIAQVAQYDTDLRKRIQQQQ